MSASKGIPAFQKPAREEGVPGEEYLVPSAWTKKLGVFLQRVGAADVPVLLQGETGVGKEVLARQIWSCSPRANRPFLKLNCAALPSELVESELFGYERGAFTGAFRSTPGKFEMADGGTILLDEIGDMDFKLQAKLLHVLQDGEFLRLGARESVKVDVRVIAATHCDLEQAISAGRFREDLYYRLNIIRIEVPPLRQRKDEILPLARFFLNKHSKASETPVEINLNLSQTLMSHTWPGNIRELENVIRTLIVLGEPDRVAEELSKAAARRQGHSSGNQTLHFADNGNANGFERDVEPSLSSSLFGVEVSGFRKTAFAGTSRIEPSTTARFNSTRDNENASALRKVDNARRQAEVEAIHTALNATLWNRKQAAELLGIEYKALLYKMKKLGIGERNLGAAI
jgi:two-component system response regulator AtoC